MDDLEKLAEPPRALVEERDTLLRRWDIPIGHLDFAYVAACSNGRELERILQVLLSGEEGHFPALIAATEERLAVIKPTSRHLRKTTQVLGYSELDEESKENVTGDITAWLSAVHLHDDELGRHKVSSKTLLHDVPDVRQGVTPCRQVDDKSVARIRSTDYASWDRYDADTELLKLDLEAEKLRESCQQQQQQQGESKVRFATEFATEAEAAIAAAREREKGNEHYRAGDYALALECYTASIGCLPGLQNYNNRAQTYVKMQKHKEAAADARAALRYDESNIKANLRLAQCLEELQQYNEALSCCEVIVGINPNCTIAQNMMNRLYAKLNRNTIPSKSTRLTIQEIGDDEEVKSPKKAKKSILKKPPPEPRKQRPSTVLLPIPGTSSMPPPYYIEVDNSDPEMVRRHELIINNQPQMLHMGHIDLDDEDCIVIHQPHITRELPNMLEEVTPVPSASSTSLSAPEVTLDDNTQLTDAISCDSLLTMDDIGAYHRFDDEELEADEDSESETARVRKLTAAEGVLQIVELQLDSVENLIDANQNRAPERPLEVNSNENDETGAGGEPKVNEAALFAGVNTPYGFLKAWQEVQTDSTYALHAQLLRHLNPNRMFELIGFKLDVRMLYDLLNCLYLHFMVANEVRRVHAIIVNISHVQRFELVAMFLGDRERRIAGNVIQFLEQHGMPLTSEVRCAYLGSSS